VTPEACSTGGRQPVAVPSIDSANPRPDAARMDPLMADLGTYLQETLSPERLALGLLLAVLGILVARLVYLTLAPPLLALLAWMQRPPAARVDQALWICRSCRSSSPESAGRCYRCGEPREQAQPTPA
jgi:hypothetical protein